MDPISNVDRLVLLLRQRLIERSKVATGKSERRGASVEQAPGGMQQVHALAAVESVDDRQLKRALIHGILAEQLGENLINEAKFQQVVDRVTETLNDDPAASKLLSGLVQELRASAH